MTPLLKIRKYRIGPFAVLDLVGTILSFYLLSRYMNTNPFLTIGWGFSLGVLAHEFVKQETPLNNIIKDLL